MATIVVLLAVVISLLKVFLPYADNYKHDIESYLLDEFNADVEIGSIGASWQKLGPAIILNDVTLSATEQAPLDISIDETKINIDFWRTLKEQRLVTGAFLLDGIETKINSDVFFKVRPQSQGTQLFEGLSHLFLSQVQEFSVINSTVLVRHMDGQQQTYQVDDLVWVNEGNHHRGQGEVFIDGFSNNSLRFQMALYGQRRSEIFGQIYVEAQQLDITPWLKQFVGEHVAVTSTEANFRVWSSVTDGLVTDIQIDVNDTGVRWQKSKDNKHLFVQGAKVNWQQIGADWHLQASEIKLDTDLAKPQSFDLSVTKTNSETLLRTQNVAVEAIAPLLSLFSVTKETAILANTDIQGTVSELAMLWPESGQMQAVVDVDNFSFVPERVSKEAYVGLSDTHLTGAWSGNVGWLSISDTDGQLDTFDTFNQPFDYQALNIDVALKLFDSGLEVNLERLLIRNDEISIKAAADFTRADAASINDVNEESIQSDTHLSLYAEVVGPKQGKIVDYLPKHLIGPQTHAYLTRAIKSGEGVLTRVIIDGAANNIPYTDSQGTFLVDATIINGEFEFDESWPAIKNMDAKLIVDKLTMGIAAEQGKIGSLTIDNDVYAELDLGAPNTLLTLSISPDSLSFKDFHALVETSPLSSIIGEVFSFVQLDGVGAVNVDLQLPLDDNLDRDGNRPQTVAQGTVQTNKAKLSLPSLNLDFDNVDALVSFENEAFAIHQANATWFDLPVSMFVAGNQANEFYSINGQLSADWESEALAKQIDGPITNYFDGNIVTDLTVNVSLEEEGYSYAVKSDSDLTNTSYSVTGPLIKDKGISSTLGISVVGNDTTNNLYIDLDDLVHFVGEASNATGVIDRAILSVSKRADGNSEAEQQVTSLLPDAGFDINIDLAGAEFDPTLGFVLDLLASLPSSNEADNLALLTAAANSAPSMNEELVMSDRFLGSPDRISGVFGYVDILGQRWQDVTLLGEQKSNGLQFDVVSDLAELSVFVHDELDVNGIDINAKRLKIINQAKPTTGPKSTEETVSSSVPETFNSAELISSLPDLHVLCEVCTFNTKPLGKVTLDTFSRDKTLFIEKATMAYQRNEVTLTGVWIGNDGSGTTNLSGDIYSRYFGQWMLDWDLNTGIKQSDLHAKLSLTWEGAPHEFEFTDLNGDTTFELGEGYLSEVSDKGARIFSLFSLNSLYRKLKFDFKDVFQKGLFYNDIKGTMQIENGVVYSEDIFMDGVAGNMNMRGFTNLVNNTLDYDVTFKPKITSSIPVIAAWLAPGTAGLSFLAGIAIDKIIEKADVVSEVRLKITGELVEPQVQEVKRFTKTIDIPGAKEAKEKALREKAAKEQAEQEKADREKAAAETVIEEFESAPVAVEFKPVSETPVEVQTGKKAKTTNTTTKPATKPITKSTPIDPPS